MTLQRNSDDSSNVFCSSSLGSQIITVDLTRKVAFLKSKFLHNRFRLTFSFKATIVRLNKVTILWNRKTGSLFKRHTMVVMGVKRASGC